MAFLLKTLFSCWILPAVAWADSPGRGGVLGARLPQALRRACGHQTPHGAGTAYVAIATLLLTAVSTAPALAEDHKPLAKLIEKWSDIPTGFTTIYDDGMVTHQVVGKREFPILSIAPDLFYKRLIKICNDISRYGKFPLIELNHPSVCSPGHGSAEAVVYTANGSAITIAIHGQCGEWGPRHLIEDKSGESLKIEGDHEKSVESLDAFMSSLDSFLISLISGLPRPIFDW